MPTIAELRKKNVSAKKPNKGLSVFDEILNDCSESPDPNEITETEKPKKKEKPVKKVENVSTTEQAVYEDVGTLVKLKPDECEPWHLADRLPQEMGDIEALAQDIDRHGQTVPILVRPATDNTGAVKYEIIYGHRRWKAASLLGKPLIARIRHLSDAEGMSEQMRENMNREGISNYSRARNIKQAIEKGIYKTQEEAGIKLGLSKSAISELLAFTKISDEFLNRTENIHLLSFGKLKKILSLIKKYPQSEEVINQCADDICTGKRSLDTLERKFSKEKTLSSREDQISNEFFTIKKGRAGKLTIEATPEAKTLLQLETISELIDDFLKKSLQG